MARRRMFSTEVVNSDPFLDMPASSQALYFHLGVLADDDGFISPNKVIRMVGSNADDLKILISKLFVIPFESGVVVMRHWKENNYIRSDRYSPTTHRDEFRQLVIDGNVYRLDTIGIPNGSIGREVGKKVGNNKIPSLEDKNIEEEKKRVVELLKSRR